MILYSVICPSRQKTSYLGPLISILKMGLNYNIILLFSPLLLFNVRIQVIMPSLPTLFTDSSWECLGYVRPIFGSEFTHPLEQYLILFRGPRPLHQVRVKHFLPSMEALHITSVIKIRGNLFPISRLFDKIQLNILRRTV